MSDCYPVRMKVIFREAILAADVERVIVARENKSESSRVARLAADVKRVIVARENEC